MTRREARHGAINIPTSDQMRRERQIAIGQQLRLERELPKELPPELALLLIRRDKEHDPYYDVVGTC